MRHFSENFRSKSLLAKIDARVRIIACMAVLLMVLSSKGYIFPVIIALACLSLCMRMRVPMKVLFLRFGQPLLLALVVLVLKSCFTGREALFSMDLMGLEIFCYRDGFAEGLHIAGRIFGGVSIVIMLGFATPFTDFIAALLWLRFPRQFIEIMMFAYRYLFVFFDEGMTIYNAQKNRLGYSGIRKGLKSFGTLTGALVLKSLDQSQKTSEAMMQRGYTGSMPLTEWGSLKPGDLLLATVFIVLAGLIWIAL